MLQKWMIAFGFLLSTWASADDAPLVVADLVPRGSVLLEQSTQRGEHELMAASMKRLLGKTQTDRSVWVEGERTGQTWEWSKRAQFDDAVARVKAKLTAYQTTFQCEGRDCGSNQLWANDVFEIPRLVGRDNQQFYALMQRSDVVSVGDNGEWVVIYVVQRNRHQVMIHLERLQGKLLESFDY